MILIDLHLKDLDAKEVVKSVRANPDLQLTKIIGLSGKITDAEAKLLTTQGFDGFLRKPFHVRQVIQTIEQSTSTTY